FWLVRCMCGWRDTFEVFPAIAVAGGSFAVCQYVFAHSAAFPLTDIAGGLVSLIVTAIFLRFWTPKRIWRMEIHNLDDDSDSGEPIGLRTHVTMARMSLKATVTAWAPFLILCGVMVFVGMYKKPIDSWAGVGSARAYYELHIPGLDGQVQRT